MIPSALQNELPGLAGRLVAGGAIYLVARWYFAYLWRLFIGRMIAGVLLFFIFMCGMGLLFAPAYTVRILTQMETFAFGSFLKHSQTTMQSPLRDLSKMVVAPSGHFQSSNSTDGEDRDGH